MTSIELFHADLVEASIDGVECDHVSATSRTWRIKECPDVLTIDFLPTNIIPLLRVNDFLINHWLAGVEINDGVLRMPLGDGFAERYQQRDIQGRLQSLGPDPSAIVLDRNLGRQLHQDLVDQLQNLIYEKSGID